ncbi:two-component system response regulator CreB [Niveibacterium umoris]|uniref:Two-component system catabolic regulation response regulator CreB n=1 Tax=Niveibacterium umoris TaxID=1193620 RepID=A0A840BI32_9RHOO|nr:two-component system response regulator CreB [Niveibacterium umoris]MBB4011242.1 two-component system catabolic regulation response regulator CreB [Niveibacterium umoris]
MSRILIIDDEPAIADTLAYVLRSEGHLVRHVKDAAGALNVLQEDPPDLALVDVGLPDLSGFELVRRIRAFSMLPVIFLTARSDEIDRVTGFELGADDYVVKPFSPREVAGRVRAILRRAGAATAPQSAPTAEFRVIEPEARIEYRGQTLALTRFEYRLLLHLLRAPRRVFSREQLLDAVWGNERDSTDRTVDTHIKTLRAKLRDVAPDADPIQTHRGLGYSVQP